MRERNRGYEGGREGGKREEGRRKDITAQRQGWRMDGKRNMEREGVGRGEL